jgi:predicted aconitase
VEQDKRPKHEDVKVMATLSRYIQKDAHKLGYIKQLERFGVTFINDTCWCTMTDEPIIPPSKDATIMTNSGKYAHYGVGLTNRRLRFGSLAECVNASKDGVRFLIVVPVQIHIYHLG